MEKKIGHLIDEMNNPERLIFVSYYYNQMSVEEIVRETGLSKEIITRHLTNCSKKVVKEIGSGEMYYAALIAFLSMSNEATNCRPPKYTKSIL